MRAKFTLITSLADNELDEVFVLRLDQLNSLYLIDNDYLFNHQQDEVGILLILRKRS